MDVKEEIKLRIKKNSLKGDYSSRSIFNFSNLSNREILKKPSFSSKKDKNRNSLFQNKNLNLNNEDKYFSSINMSIKNDNPIKNSLFKLKVNNNQEFKRSSLKKKTLDIFQTKTKKIYEKYNLIEKKVINNDNLKIQKFKKNSINDLQNNLKLVLNNMAIKIENEEKEDFSQKNDIISPRMLKGRRNSTPAFKFIKTKKRQRTKKKSKIAKDTFLSNNNLINEINDSFGEVTFKQRSKSFNIPAQNIKKLLKRMYNKLNKINSFQKIDKVDVNELDSSDEIKIIGKSECSFHPNCTFIFIFDIMIMIANLYFFIFIPLKIAKSDINKKGTPLNQFIIYLMDIIYIADFIITSFRGYYNNEMEIIRSNRLIMIHYLKKEFFIDLLEAVPLNTFVYMNIINFNNLYFGYINSKIFIYKLLMFIKPFKIFKIIGKKKNIALENFYGYFSENYHLEKLFLFFTYFLICFLFIHLFICLHIFFSLQNYPNWISNINIINKNFFEKYITSFYFLMTTMTTVGYGDIVCISFVERIFHIILLAIGTILYTFLVSKIGNYLREQNHEQIKLDKDLNILESIRISYPTMPFKLYSKIKNHLLNISKKRKKTGISLLINGIPDTIKNDLLLKIYSKIIDKFSIFKNVNNSRFILQVLTSFIPITIKKEEIILVEGELVDNIIFVKDGRISMEISIDINDPYKSIQNYLENNFNEITGEDKKSFNNLNQVNDSKLITNRNFNDLKEEIDNVLFVRQNGIKDENSLVNNNGISADLGRLDFSRKETDSRIEENYDIIKIFDIRKNEHFGDIHLFLKKPSPFTLKAKSRIVEVLLLRKYDSLDISNNFPNIWRKIHDKSYHNLLSLKKLTFKKLKQYYNTHFACKENNEKNFGFNIENQSSNSILSLLENPALFKINKKLNLIKPFSNNNIINITKKKNRSSKFLGNHELFIGDYEKKKTSFKTLNNILGSTNNYNKELKSNISSIKLNQSFIKPVIKKTSKDNEKIKNVKINNLINGQKIFDKFNLSENQKLNNSFNTEKNKNKIKSKFYKEQLFNNNNDDKYNTSFDDFKEILININDSKIESINYEKTTNKTIKYNRKREKTNYSNENEYIYTLEDVAENISKKIRKKIKMKQKIHKIINSLEFQRNEEKDYLIKLYSNVITNKLNFIFGNDAEITKNLKNNIINELINIPLSKCNTKEFSKLLDSTISEEYSQKKFVNLPLKKILTESFEIKSSYKNLNVLSEGKIINNSKYKKYLEKFIKQDLNKINFDNIKFKELNSKKTLKINSNKNKEEIYKKFRTHNFQNNLFSNDEKISLNLNKRFKNRSSYKNFDLHSSKLNLKNFFKNFKFKSSKNIVHKKKGFLSKTKTSNYHKKQKLEKIEDYKNNNKNGIKYSNKTHIIKGNIEEEKNLFKLSNIEKKKKEQITLNNTLNLNNSSFNILTQSDKNNVQKIENNEITNNNDNNNYNNNYNKTFSEKNKFEEKNNKANICLIF